jgi:hypothetical protein
VGHLFEDLEMSDIFLNGVPMVWVGIDENSNGDLVAVIADSASGDLLIPVDQFDGSVPAEYWEREQWNS